MIRTKILKDLVQHPGYAFPVTSAYFTFDYVAGNRKHHLVEIKKQIRYKKDTTYFKQLNPAEQDSVLRDFDKILAWYSDGLNPAEASSSICFTSSGAGLWQTLNFKRPLAVEDLVIQPLPYIRPLVTMFSVHRAYIVVLIDKIKARVFASRLGEFTELYHIEDNAPGSIKVGGFGGRQERRVERNIHQAVIQHYKMVAQKILEIDQKNGFEWIVLGGRKDVIAEFSKYLHTYVKAKVSGQVETEPNAPLSEVLEKVKTLENQTRGFYEQRLLQDFTEKKVGGRAVDGLPAVLTKIQENSVGSLLVQEDFKIKGVFCRQCHFLAINPAAGCPHGCGLLERTNDLVEQILHLALRQGVVVQVVKNAMEAEGKIAALLRFPIGG